MRAGTSKLKCEACSLIMNTKWWTVMLRLLWSLICKLWTGNLDIRIVSWTLQAKSGLEMMSEQPEEIENGVQICSIWGQNEQLGGVWKGLWDQQPGLMSSKWSQGCLSPVPIKHFGTVLDLILEDFWDKNDGKRWSLFQMCFRARNLMTFWSILVPNSNQAKMRLGHKFWNVQSRFLNNSPCVLKVFALLVHTWIQGFGSKNRLRNQAWERYRSAIDFWWILGSKIIENWVQNRWQSDVEHEVVFKTVWARVGGVRCSHRPAAGGGVREPFKEGDQ